MGCFLSYSSSIGLITSWRYHPSFTKESVSSSRTDLLACEKTIVQRRWQYAVQRSLLNEGRRLRKPRHTGHGLQACCKSRCGVIRRKHNPGQRHDQFDEQASSTSHTLGHNQMVLKLSLVSTTKDRLAAAPLQLIHLPSTPGTRTIQAARDIITGCNPDDDDLGNQQRELNPPPFSRMKRIYEHGPRCCQTCAQQGLESQELINITRMFFLRNKLAIQRVWIMERAIQKYIERYFIL